MTKDRSTKPNGLDELIDSIAVERVKSLEREVRATTENQSVQARKAEAYMQLAESTPEEFKPDLSGFAGLSAKAVHYHFRYCYSLGFGDAVMFISRILGISKADSLTMLMQQKQGADSHPMRESVYSRQGLFSISEGEDILTSSNDFNRETSLWQFITECRNERLCMIGSEGLSEPEYQELCKEIETLVIRLEEALPEGKKGLVEEYDDLITEEESLAEEVFYVQGFVDGIRMLWENYN